MSLSSVYGNTITAHEESVIGNALGKLTAASQADLKSLPLRTAYEVASAVLRNPRSSYVVLKEEVVARKPAAKKPAAVRPSFTHKGDTIDGIQERIFDIFKRSEINIQHISNVEVKKDGKKFSVSINTNDREIPMKKLLAARARLTHFYKLGSQLQTATVVNFNFTIGELKPRGKA